MPTVHDVAAYILEKQGAMSTMKLQKLAYYSQAWHLVWAEEPLFPEEIQAWANGPVVYPLYQKHKGRFQIETWPDGDSSLLNAAEKGTIDAVLEAYGKFSGQQLSDLSHREGPWLAARGDTPKAGASNAPISLESIQGYYSAVAADDSSTSL